MTVPVSQTGSSKKPLSGMSVLVEASKLADSSMDGVKRYVLELLTAFSRIEPAQRPRLDVMVLDEVYPLDEALARLQAPPSKAGSGKTEVPWLRWTASLVPPVLLSPIKRMIPAFLWRRISQVEKPSRWFPEVEKLSSQWPVLLLPPLLADLLRRILPNRVLCVLWAQGALRPMPTKVNPDEYDLVHHTLPNNWHFLRATQTPKLVTVHDLCHLACPQYQTWSNTFTLKMGLEEAVSDGARFLAVSNSTREQLSRAFDLEPSSVFLAENGFNAKHFHPVTDPEVRRAARRKYGIPETPFLLTLSTIEPRKNLARTIEAFGMMLGDLGEANINLVIAGPRGWKSRQVIRSAQSGSHIHLPGYLATEDLAAIYSSARGFVYASHYEGFGLPLLEAMSCATPVIYGDNSSMPEIAGDAGLAVDSRDTAAMAGYMKRLVTDDHLAQQLGQRALVRSRKFTWDRAARETLEAYRDVLG